MIHGNARVSSDVQSVAAQGKELRDAGAEKVFRETASGAKTDRVQLRRALAQLDAEDVLLVTRLDCLARSTRDFYSIGLLRSPPRAQRSASLAIWADTTTAHGRLILIVLGGLAEFERELICPRTGEGRARAVANGVKLGCKPTLTPHQRQEAKRRVKARKESLGEIARSYNAPPASS